MLEFIKEADRTLFLFLNGLHNPVMDVIMYYASHRGFWIPAYVVMIAILWRYYRNRAVVLLLLLVPLLLLSDQISAACKAYFERPRPCFETDLAALIHLVQGHCGGPYGFFSSHASNAGAVAFYLLFTIRRDFPWITWLILAAALLISYSRIYLGVHYPFDVIAGLLLGLLLGFGLSRVFFFLDSRRKNSGNPLRKEIAEGRY